MNNLQSKAKKDRLVEILNKHKLSQDFYNNTQSYEVSFSYIMREYIDNLYGEDNLELPLFLKRSDFKDDYRYIFKNVYNDDMYTLLQFTHPNVFPRYLFFNIYKKYRTVEEMKKVVRFLFMKVSLNNRSCNIILKIKNEFSKFNLTNGWTIVSDDLYEAILSSVSEEDFILSYNSYNTRDINIVPVELAPDCILKRKPVNLWTKEDAKEVLYYFCLKGEDSDGTLTLSVIRDLSREYHAYCFWEKINKDLKTAISESLSFDIISKFKSSSIIKEWNDELARKAIIDLCDNKIGWTEYGYLKTKLSPRIIRKEYKGLLEYFNNDIFALIEHVYPNQFKPWEVVRGILSESTITDELTIKVIKHLVEDKLKMTREEICNEFNSYLLANHKLSSLLNYYNGRVYTILNIVYPNQFLPYEMKISPMNYWNLETARDAVDHLFNNVLKWSIEDIQNKFYPEIFAEHNLQGMVGGIFGGSNYAVLEIFYPNTFDIAEIKRRLSSCSLTKEEFIEKVKNALNEKSNNCVEKIPSLINRPFLESLGSGTTYLKKYFNGSIYNLVDEMYPNKFKQWELPKCESNFWNKERAIEATKWLIEDKLKWDEETIKKNLNTQVFRDNNLSAMIQKIYKTSSFNALDAAYPGKFKPWELEKSSTTWTIELCREAVRWLVCEKTNFTPEEALDKVTYSLFKKYRVYSPVIKYYNFKTRDAIKDAFNID